jgi:transcription initiation factor TFIIB
MQYVKNQVKETGTACIECGKKSIVEDFDTKEKSCSGCGIVVDEPNIDYATDETKKEGSGGRTGPQEDPMMQMGTMISQTGKDAFGKQVKATYVENGKSNNYLYGIITQDKRSKSKGIKTIIKANNEIIRLCNELKINEEIKQRGAEIFRDVKKEKMTAGRDALVLSAACLYLACRESGQSKTIKDFMRHCNCKTTIFIRYFRTIQKTFEIQTEIMSPKKFISRIASRTEPPINAIIEKHACDIVDQLSDQAGKDPIGLAAAALCYVCRLKNYKHTLRNIAIAASVNEVTVRNRIKDIEKYHNKK